MTTTVVPEDDQITEEESTPAGNVTPDLALTKDAVISPESASIVFRRARRTEEVMHLRDCEAEYDLEFPAVCTACQQTIMTVKVVRLMRTRVNFTSTLPRRGRVVICPNCRAVMSAALTLV